MPHFSASKSPKALLRKDALAQRAELPIPTISQAIQKALQGWPDFQTAEQVLFYYPFRNEVDLQSLATEYPEKRWYLPVVSEQAKMTFHPYHPDLPLTLGKYGIAEPQPDGQPFKPTHESTLILIPGVLFDRQGYRLGYGKGYYDRFLIQLGEHTERCIRVGITPDALITDTLPHDPWDIPMHFMATEHGVHPVQPSAGHH